MKKVKEAADGRETSIFEVKVIPRSSRTEVSELGPNTLKVKLTAPPVDGAANSQLIEALSEHFGIRKSDVVILKGESSRQKKLKLNLPGKSGNDKTKKDGDSGGSIDSEHDRIWKR